MKVKIKKLVETAVIPSKAHSTDAGFDLIATSVKFDEYGNIVYGTGLAIEIPDGYAGFIFPRSSVSKYDLALCNSVGIVDSCYRGEIMFKFKPTSSFFGEESNSEDFKYIDEPDREECKLYHVGDKIGQLVIMPYPAIEFEESDKLSDSERGIGGFGSTGV